MTHDVTTELQELRAAMAAQQQRIEELERHQTGVAAARTPGIAPAPAVAVPDDERRSGTIDRRALLGLAGAGIAGAAVLGSASPAAADDGDNIAIGTQAYTDSANPTVVGYTGPNPVAGTNGAFAGRIFNESNSSNAVAGETLGPGVGVIGLNFHPSSGGGLAAQNSNASPATSSINFGSGPGVYASSSSGIGGVFVSDSGAPLQLFARGTPGPPTSGFWAKGSFIVDAPGNLFVCSGSGTPGTWKKATASSGIEYLPTPVRGYDSRPGEPGPGIKSKLSTGETRTISLFDALDGQTSDVAVLANVTVTATSSAGFLSVYSGASPDLDPPTFSSINWTATGQTIANSVQSAMSNALLKVYAARPTHVIVDVVGYVEGDFNAVG